MIAREHAIELSARPIVRWGEAWRLNRFFRGVALKEGGELMLFFGARIAGELPYFGPLLKLPKDFIDITFAQLRAELRGQGRYHVETY